MWSSWIIEFRRIFYGGWLVALKSKHSQRSLSAENSTELRVAKVRTVLSSICLFFFFFFQRDTKLSTCVIMARSDLFPSRCFSGRKTTNAGFQSRMPMKIGCPGAPKCMHVFKYVPAQRAHIQTCKYAQDKKAAAKGMDTTMPELLEEAKRGNITIAGNSPCQQLWWKTWTLHFKRKSFLEYDSTVICKKHPSVVMSVHFWMN